MNFTGFDEPVNSMNFIAFQEEDVSARRDYLNRFQRAQNIDLSVFEPPLSSTWANLSGRLNAVNEVSMMSISQASMPDSDSIRSGVAATLNDTTTSSIDISLEYNRIRRHDFSEEDDEDHLREFSTILDTSFNEPIIVTRQPIVTGEVSNPIPILIIGGSRTKKPTIVFTETGFEMIKDATRNGKAYWRCKNHGVNGCSARAVTKAIDIIIQGPTDGQVLETKEDVTDIFELKMGNELSHEIQYVGKNEHSSNCRMIVGGPYKLILLRAIKTMSLEKKYDHVDAGEILKKAKDMYVPDGTPLCNFPTDKNLCKMINRYRQSVRPKPPNEDGSNIIEWDFDLTRLDSEVPEDFFRGSSTSVYRGKDRRHFLFATKDQLKYLQKASDISFDGTFGPVKKPHYQLFTVHATLAMDDGCQSSMPIAYALMMGKAEVDYTSVLTLLKTTVENVTSEEMRVKRILVDYEVAIWNAIRNVFGENVRVRGCWFHFNQAIYKQVKKLNLEKDYLKGTEMHQMIRYLMTLPLMDARNIPKVFDILLEEYQPTINSKENVKKLFNYFKKQWMGQDYFKPSDWSCFEKQIRTNNQVESWNKIIFSKANKKSQNIYLLTEILAKDAIEAVNDIEKYSRSHYVKRIQAGKNSKILEAYHQYRRHGNSFQTLKRLATVTTTYCQWTLFGVGEEELASDMASDMSDAE